MDFDLNSDIRKLDSMTKYPSILTYHQIGDKGRLKEELSFNAPSNQELIATEKIDGENSRMVFIVTPRYVDYFIGSRDELIYAKGDRVINKKGNMVNTIKPFADNICNNISFLYRYLDKLVVIYSESYGGTVQKASKQYTTDSNLQSIRVFDSFVMDLDEVQNILDSKDLSQISTWRENNQSFVDEKELQELSKLIHINLTPRRDYIVTGIPTNLKETYQWLQKYRDSFAGINKLDGEAEGIVLRNNDRSYIVKLRFEDYERTLRNK